MAKATKTATPPEPPRCMNCKFSEINGGLRCMIDLPPWVRASDDPRRYVVNPNGVCALHKPDGL